MSAAVRWLALVSVGWAGARAIALGIVPGTDLYTLGRAQAAVAPAAPAARFPALEAAVPFDAAANWQTRQLPPATPPAGWTSAPIIIPYPVPAFRPFEGSAPPLASRFVSAARWAPALYPPVAPMEEWPLTRFASRPLSAAIPPVSPRAAAEPTLKQPRFDRVQLTAWALLRGAQGIGTPPRSLAGGGTLGGSQAGARLTYRFSPEFAASLRSTSAVGTSQSEIAAGIRVTPIRSLPVSFTAERRQAIGSYGGRSAFALFAEGGLYGQSLLGMDLDGYAQAGVVGFRDRAMFADGALTFSRPVYRQFSAGIGVWGGIQPGVYRIDAGPRLSYRVRPNVRAHIDWRQRLAGSAMPGSGPTLTLAGDF